MIDGVMKLCGAALIVAAGLLGASSPALAQSSYHYYSGQHVKKFGTSDDEFRGKGKRGHIYGASSWRSKGYPNHVYGASSWRWKGYPRRAFDEARRTDDSMPYYGQRPYIEPLAGYAPVTVGQPRGIGSSIPLIGPKHPADNSFAYQARAENCKYRKVRVNSRSVRTRICS